MLGHMVLWKSAFHSTTKAELPAGSTPAEQASFERRLGRHLRFTPAFVLAASAGRWTGGVDWLMDPARAAAAAA